MIAWTSYKKGINLISWLVLQNQHAIFFGWDLSVFFCLKNYYNTKYCNVQIWHLWLCICTSGHHKFSKFIRPNFLIKTLKCIDLDSYLANYQSHKLYILKFSCPETIRPLIRGQSHSPNVYHNSITSSTKRLLGAS